MYEFDRDRPADAARRVAETATTEGPVGIGPTAKTPRHALDAGSVLHLQRTAGNASVVQLLSAEDEERSPVHDILGSGGGSPLDAETRTSMEQAFGQSFSDVRMHTGAAASRSAESVGANAYTVGSDIVFRGGHGPGSATFQRDIAHELTHVTQQRAGPVDGTDAPGGIRLSDPSDRFERAADARASEITSNTTSSASGSQAAPAVQRTEEEQDVLPVQRMGETPDDEEEAESL
jgi:hypothetical protein